MRKEGRKGEREEGRERGREEWRKLITRLSLLIITIVPVLSQYASIPSLIAQFSQLTQYYS